MHLSMTHLSTIHPSYFIQIIILLGTNVPSRWHFATLKFVKRFMTYSQRYATYKFGTGGVMFPAIRYRLSFFVLILLLLIPAVQSVTAQDAPDGGLKLLSFAVSYGGKTYDSAANQTTFSYIVTGVDQRPDLSHFDVGLPDCSPALLIVATSPTDAVSFGVDPTTGVNGIKWDLPLKTTDSRTYSITFFGNVVEGSVQVAVKADGFEIGSLPGPSCTSASIDVDKFLSTDGITWEDADNAPGPEVESDAQVWFRFVITNIGNAELSAITLNDNRYDTSGCTLPAKLAPGVFTECTIGPFPAEEGQHTNVATATGTFASEVVIATDAANYFSGNLPQIVIEKSISKDGGESWGDTIRVKSGRDISYKFAVTNIGNVALTNFTLSDDSYDASSCTLPDTLEPEGSFECVIGPFPAGNANHTNTATVTASFEDKAVTASDTASYRISAKDDDDDSGIIIIIEGPIKKIDGNIIIIFDIEIEIDPNDPIIRTIRVGDTIRIEGDLKDDGDRIIIIAVTIIIIDIDIIIIGPPGQPIIVPGGCKLTGFGNGNIRCKGASGKSSRGSGRSGR